MVGIGFLDPDAEGLHHGEIVERKEEGFFGQVEIDMLVPHPRGHAEDVVRLPVETHDIFRSEEHTSELQSLMRISYAVFCLKKKNNICRSKTYIKQHTSLPNTSSHLTPQ